MHLPPSATCLAIALAPVEMLVWIFESARLLHFQYDIVPIFLCASALAQVLGFMLSVCLTNYSCVIYVLVTDPC